MAEGEVEIKLSIKRGRPLAIFRPGKGGAFFFQNMSPHPPPALSINEDQSLIISKCINVIHRPGDTYREKLSPRSQQYGLRAQFFPVRTDLGR